MRSDMFDQLNIGFSFGLRPDSSPGEVNGAIVKTIQQYRTNRAFLGIQWELAVLLDRLEAPWNGVAATPYIVLNDLTHPNDLIAKLITPQKPAEQQLATRLSFPIRNEKELVSKLNSIIDDLCLYVTFRPIIKLADLPRNKKNKTWMEYRNFPMGSQPLHPLHARRINRFILETIFSDEIKPHPYLNTTKVANELLDQFEVSAYQETCIHKILLFCHPLHLSWCAYNIAKKVEELGDKKPSLFCSDLRKEVTRIHKEFERLRDQGINPVPPEILNIATETSPLLWGPSSHGEMLDPNNTRWWDSESSQEWTRNRSDYEEYNAS